jgi:hypothetical protein
VPRYVVREIPHPFKKGDRVLFAGTKCVVKSTSWEGDEPYVIVLPYSEEGEVPVSLGAPGYRIRASSVERLSAVEQLGEIVDE